MGVPKSLDYKDFMRKSNSVNPTTWDDMYRFFGNQGEITAALVKSLLYQPSTSYSIGAIVYSPNLPAGTIAKCTNAGTTGSTEPAWPAVGSAVYDGTARWIVENMQSASSPDSGSNNQSAKYWAEQSKTYADNSASSASSSQSSATASASSASDAKVSETNAAKSATAAAQSAENAKLFDPTSYAKRSEIFPITDTGRRDIKHTITDLNDIKCISSPSWSCLDSSYIKTMSNCPTQTAFYLFNVRNGVSSASKNDTFTNLTSYYYYIVQLLLDIGGNMWVRTCFNSSKETFGFSNWKRVAFINDLPTKTSQLTNDSGFAVISNGHFVINGSELWIE